MTVWIVSFCVSVIILLTAFSYVIWSACAAKGVLRPIKPFYAMVGAVFFATLAMYFPVYLRAYSGLDNTVWVAALLTIYNSIRLFFSVCDFSFITANTVSLDLLGSIYSSYAAVLFVIAPVMTLGFVLSFFKNAIEHIKLSAKAKRELYVFSEVNDKTIALAKDLKENHPKCVILFVNTGDEQALYRDSLAQMDAIVLQDDILKPNYKVKNRKAKLCFFLFSQNEDENVDEALKLMEKYGAYKNVYLYLLASSDKSEQIFKELPSQQMKVRRINEYYSLVARTLYEHGDKIFDSAVDNEVSGEKDISVLIVGLSEHGKLLLSSLAWFCQMDGYHTEITAFDSDTLADDRFVETCPELMSDKFNGDFTTDGEAHYKITINSGYAPNTYSFEEKVSAIKNITYVFIGVGDDDVNIKTAIQLRILFRRLGINPVINALVSNVSCLDALSSQVTNEYDINFIGDVKTLYTEREILSPKLNELALSRHLKWGKEESFWKNEYEYRSSIASVIHSEYKKKYAKHIGGDKLPEDRTESELWAIRKLEHQRWNAYMRSVGYVYAPVKDKTKKTHNCLVAFDKLPYEEQIKDDF